MCNKVLTMIEPSSTTNLILLLSATVLFSAVETLSWNILLPLFNITRTFSARL